MYKYIALASGFAMMAFELVAARLLAPTIGSSTFIWTNVIGVIMGALAIGYWWGGKLADQRKQALDIARLCLAMAALVMFVLLFHAPLIDIARSLSADARWQGFVAALILFAPASVVIGMISPYLAKLSLSSTKETGQKVAQLSTWNAIGSIAGTFITGFFLFGIIGSRATLLVVIVIMLAASWLVEPACRLWRRIGITALILLISIVPLIPVDSAATISIDTPVSNYQIVKSRRDGREVIYLRTGPRGYQSGVYSSGDKDLVFWYTEEIASVVATVSDPQRILIIGGGAFTLPEYLGRLYPDAQVDVVEIDPELESIAREHFRFDKPDNVVVYAEDARSYVNRVSDIAYDIIIIDVFSDADIPWQFITAEFGSRSADLLSDDGIVIMNAIFAQTAGCEEIKRAEIATFSARLPHAYIKPYPTKTPQHTINHEIIFSRTPLPDLPTGYDPYDPTDLTAYHDDFAPIEHIWQACLSSAR